MLEQAERGKGFLSSFSFRCLRSLEDLLASSKGEEGERERRGRERVRDSGGSAPANLRSSVGLFLPRENGPRFCVSVAGKRFRATTTSKERSKVAVSRMRNFDRGQNFNFRVG